MKPSKNYVANYHEEEDVLVHKDEDNPEWLWGVQVTELDGKYLALYTFRDTARVWFIPFVENSY